MRHEALTIASTTSEVVVERSSDSMMLTALWIVVTNCTAACTSGLRQYLCVCTSSCVRICTFVLANLVEVDSRSQLLYLFILRDLLPCLFHTFLCDILSFHLFLDLRCPFHLTLALAALAIHTHIISLCRARLDVLSRSSSNRLLCGLELLLSA